MDSLNKIKNIINTDSNNIKNINEFKEFIEQNLENLQEIANLKHQEILEIKESFYKFILRFRTDFFNSDYEETYASFIKIAILFFEKTNNIGQIQNFIEYFNDDDPYKYKIQALIEFRQLSDKKDLPKKIKYIAENLITASSLGENQEPLINILKEYFNKLFSQEEFQDYDSRKVFIEEIKDLDNLKPFLDDISLKKFLEDRLQEETIIESPEISETEQDLTAIRIELDLLKSTLEEKDKVISELEEKINLLLLDNDTEQSILKEKINSLQGDFSLITKEKNTLQKEIELYRQLPSETKVIEELKNGNRELSKIINELNFKVKEKENQISEKDTDLNNAKKTIDELQKTIEVLESGEKQSPTVVSLEDTKIAILGSQDGKNYFNFIKKEKWFEGLGLNVQNIKYIETWRDERRTSIYDLAFYDIVLIGENDHYLKDVKTTSKDAIFQHLKNDSMFNDVIVLKIKLEQNSSKPPRITKSSLKKTIDLSLDEYKTNKLNDFTVLK